MAVTQDQVRAFDFGSNLQAGESFRQLGLGADDVSDAVQLAVEESETKGLRLTRGLLETAPDLDGAAEELQALVSWAAGRDSVARAMVARAARLSGGGVLFVDRVSTIPAVEARVMVADFLASGGARGDVLMWLATAGAALRRHRPGGDHLGGVVDWVGDRIEDGIDAISEGVESIVDAIVDAAESLGEAIADAVGWTVDQLGDLATALLEAGQTIGDVLAAAVEQGIAFAGRMAAALLEIGEAIGDVLDELADVAVDAIQSVVIAAIRAGQAIADVITWMANATVEAVRAAVRGLIRAAGSLVSLVIDVAQLGLELLREVVRAALEIGETLVGMMVQFAELALDTLEMFLRAAVELGLSVAEMVVELAVMTYDTVANVVAAGLRAGIAIVEFVGDVAGASYWALRRIINGIIAATGPVGEILDAVLSHVEDFADDAWHAALNALRYAEANLNEVLDWARQQGVAALESVLRAWESIGENLLDAYRWAKDIAIATGDAMFRLVGEVTFRLENSVTYVLGYLANDFLEGVEDFTIGLLEAGYAVADFVGNVVEHSIEVIGAAFRGALAIGTTLTELLVAVVTEPDRIVQHVLGALDEMNQTVTDVMAAVAEAADDLMDDIVRALREIGTSLRSMVGAFFEALGGLLGTALAILLNTFATYRPLTAHERSIGRRIFADSLDYDEIFVSQDDAINDLIFWVQDGFAESPNSRAFVTYNLINFDVDDVLTDATLIHELTHVWQAVAEGPFYVAEALHAQLDEELGGPDAYNYGYTNASNGDGAETALPGTVWDDYNPEQQGNIIEHYHVRRYQEARPQTDWDPWQPFIDHVQAAA